MRISSILRLACGVLLLAAMSSFSGCEKDGVSPTSRNGKDCKPTTTAPADTTTTSGNS